MMDLRALVEATPAEVRKAVAAFLADDLATLEGRLHEVLARVQETRLKAYLQPPAVEPDRLLEMPDVAVILGAKEERVREMGRRGELRTVPFGKRGVRVRLERGEGVYWTARAAIT